MGVIVLDGIEEIVRKGLVVEVLDVVALRVLVFELAIVYVETKEYVPRWLGRELTLYADVLVDVLLAAADIVGIA